MPDKEFDGKTVLITGGAGGFGAAFSKALAEHGASLVITDINESQGKALANAIPEEMRRRWFQTVTFAPITPMTSPPSVTKWPSFAALRV